MKPNESPQKTDITENRKLAIEHLEKLREDARGEIKQRISQRDQYSVQQTVALAALVGIAATDAFPFAYRVILAAPLISIYFTTLILYSYRIHKMISGYLQKEIEPELAKLCGTSIEREWERFYCANAVPGIRRPFFIGSLWIVCLVSPLYVGFIGNWQAEFFLPLIVLSAIYLLVASWLTITFWRK
ncbi:MAG: hypothetical protein JXA21_07340 [Anaerolineae bacterium]|nr:hypothetical protein [Anaerolineae bacterium]